MIDVEITVQKREKFGKHVHVLRNEGILPANIYGPLVEVNVPIQLSAKEFKSLYERAGETELINLTVAGESETRPILLYGVQRDPVSDAPIHVDMYQVDLTKKIDVEIPIELTGESPAVTNKLGELLFLTDTLKVRVLPTNIPHAFEVSLETLGQVGDSITVGDIKLPESVELLDAELDELIVKVDAIVEVTAEDLATPEATEALAQKTEEVTTEEPTAEKAKE